MSTLLDIGSLDRYDDDSMPDLVMMAYWSGTSISASSANTAAGSLVACCCDLDLALMAECSTN